MPTPLQVDYLEMFRYLWSTTYNLTPDTLKYLRAVYI